MNLTDIIKKVKSYVSPNEEEIQLENPEIQETILNKQNEVVDELIKENINLEKIKDLDNKSQLLRNILDILKDKEGRKLTGVAYTYTYSMHTYDLELPPEDGLLLREILINRLIKLQEEIKNTVIIRPEENGN